MADDESLPPCELRIYFSFQEVPGTDETLIKIRQYHMCHCGIVAVGTDFFSLTKHVLSKTFHC